MRSRSAMAVVLSGGGQNMPASKTGKKSKLVLCLVLRWLPPIFKIITPQQLLKLLDEHTEVTIFNTYPVFVPFFIFARALGYPRWIMKVLLKAIYESKRRWPEWKTVIVWK